MEINNDQQNVEKNEDVAPRNTSMNMSSPVKRKCFAENALDAVTCAHNFVALFPNIKRRKAVEAAQKTKNIINIEEDDDDDDVEPDIDLDLTTEGWFRGSKSISFNAGFKNFHKALQQCEAKAFEAEKEFGAEEEFGVEEEFGAANGFGVEEEFGVEKEFGAENGFVANKEFGVEKEFGAEKESGADKEFDTNNQLAVTSTLNQSSIKLPWQEVDIKTYPENWRELAFYLASFMISEHCLKTLLPGQELDDNIVNCFLQLAMHNNNNGELLIVDSQFFVTLMDNSERFGFVRWPQKVQAWKYNIWLMPKCEGGHWTLVVIIFPSKYMVYLDSLHLTPSKQLMSRLCGLLEKIFGKRDLPRYDWRLDFILPGRCPESMPRFRRG